MWAVRPLAPSDRNSWSPPLCFWGLVFRESCPGFLSPPPPLVLVLPDPFPGSASPSVHSASLWPLLAAEATASCSLHLRSFPGPAVSLLQPPSQPVPPASHLPRLPHGASPLPLSNPSIPLSALPFLSNGMEVLGWGAGHLSPSPLVHWSPLPMGPLSAHLPQPHQPWSEGTSRSPILPYWAPEITIHHFFFFLFLLFSPTFPPLFCLTVSISQECYYLI